MPDELNTTEPPPAVRDLFRAGRFAEASRAWSVHSGAPLPCVAIWCLDWLDANARVGGGGARKHRSQPEKYCNDIPGRRVADCIHCGDECRG